MSIRFDHLGPLCRHVKVDQVHVDFARKGESVVERDIARGNRGHRGQIRATKGGEHLWCTSHQRRVVQTLPVQHRQKAAGIIGGIGIEIAIEIYKGYITSVPIAKIEVLLPVAEWERDG